MSIQVKHGTQLTGPNAPGSPVSKNVWNEAHTITGTANRVLGFDGSGNATEINLASATASDLIGAKDIVAPAYLKTLSDIINGMPVDLFRFVSQAKVAGIRARTDTSDLTADIQSALDSGAGEITAQSGLYNTTGALNMSTANQCVRGSDGNRTEIRINSTTTSAIRLANGVAGYGLKGLKISRTGVPTATAHGIEFLGTTDNSTLDWLVLEDHFDNLRIGGCDTGYINNLVSRRAYRHGVYQTCSFNYGPSQWNADNVLVEKNTVDGWLMEATDGSPGMIVNPMRNFESFANGGRGFHAKKGSTTGIFDIDIEGFFGSDALAGIRLDTGGGGHKIKGHCERAGMDTTGRLGGTVGGTAATMIAPNIEITANNLDVLLETSRINNASYDGVLHQGGVLIVTGGTITNNGNAATAGRRNGILSQGGELIVTGAKIGNIASTVGGPLATSQLYGVSSSHAKVRITGSSLDNNVTAPYFLGVVATSETLIKNNTPTGMTSYP